MPLPANGSFTVLGYSRPGEAVQSKPKQAMIVRMSPETLDALQDFPNHPPMEFQFGDSPGIFIGGTFFPLVPSAENTPHDLYLRASSATKKTPPFKLHANVVGKFSVQRELAPSVGEKVRESTNEAINQRANRTTIMIDDPKTLLNGKPTLQAKQKKKRDPATSSSRTTSLIDKTKSKAVTLAARTTKNPTSSISNPLDKLSPERVQDIRRRLIHFLATGERLEDDVVRAVGGSNCTPQLRQAVCQMLEDVGEPTKPSSKQYRLKPVSWLEVRPYEWTKWSDAVRTQVCRDARLNLKALGKSESEPIWNHFVYRKTNSNGLPASTSMSSTAPSGGRDTPEPRRGIMSRDHREKMAATNKSSRKSEILMKDESRSVPKPPRNSSPNVSRSRRDDSPNVPRSRRDDSPNVPRSRRDDSPNVARSRRDDSPSVSKSRRDDSPSHMSRAASSSSSNARKQPPGSGFKSTSSKLSGSVSGDPPPSRKLNDMRPPESSSQRGTPQPGKSSQRNRGPGDDAVQESDSERRRHNQPSQPSKLSQRSKPDDYQDSDSERRRQQRTAERERERETRDKDRERGRERDREQGRDREREQHTRVKELKREREEGETSDASSTMLKRRPRPRDEDDDDFQPSRSQAHKRRKLDSLPPSLPPKPKTLAVEDRGHHRRPSDTDSQYKAIKKESSPFPSLLSKRPRSPPPKRAPPPTQTTSTNGQASSSKSVKGKPPPLKFRRGSSIYTSSEDEGELPQSSRPRPQPNPPPPPPPKSLPPPPPPPPFHTPSSSSTSSSQPTNNNSNGSVTGRVPSSLRGSRPPSKPYGQDRRSLRVRYSQAYADYMSTMLKLAVQRTKLESMLRDHDHQSAGSITDSEGDELLTPDELALLAAQNKLKHEELDAIKKEFDMMDSSGTGGSSE